MKKTIKSILAVLLALVIAICACTFAFAKQTPFSPDAYTTIVTGSDFQDAGTKAYDRFGRILSEMKNDGLPTPDTMLMGGDFTKILLDYANPGITLIRRQMKNVYPDFNQDAVYCIQGNHDNVASGLTKTGFYDMGTYCLYCINEDDFQWKQSSRSKAEKKVKVVADDLSANLDAMIESGDLRPVIVITHVPLHHTTRHGGGDNKYASYIFDVLNNAGTKLDIIFMFGHNHSHPYDDYIGGSVNYLKVGDTIRIPDVENIGEENYIEKTLNFTYTNCGYVGYSRNGVSDTSTNVLTAGTIQICSDKIIITKYSEEGFYASYTIDRVAPLEGDAGSVNIVRNVVSEKLWNLANKFFEKIFDIIYYFRMVLYIVK